MQCCAHQPQHAVVPLALTILHPASICPRAIQDTMQSLCPNSLVLPALALRLASLPACSLHGVTASMMLLRALCASCSTPCQKYCAFQTLHCNFDSGMPEQLHDGDDTQLPLSWKEFPCGSPTSSFDACGDTHSFLSRVRLLDCQRSFTKCTLYDTAAGCKLILSLV